MSAPALAPVRLKGEAFSADFCVGDYNQVMDNSNTPSISPPSEYRFPDVQPPTSAPSSPCDSPSTSATALPASPSGLSLRQSPIPLDCAGVPSFSIRDFYLPTLSPEEILDTLDHLASAAPKKKSHARKQPAGHIPRPRNAFILFRCLFVCQQAVPASVEKDHRNISRIAGKVWKSMSNEERDPWVKASELEKARHEAKWPGYRYNPVQSQALPRRFANAGFLRVAPPDARRPKREDDDDAEYDDRAREPKRALVKQGFGLDAAVHGYPAPAAYDAPPEFAMPFARAPAFGAAPMPLRAATTPGGYDFAFPPQPAIPPATHARLAMRRSSSCPPLPPVGFPFQNPNPWLSAAPSVAPSSPSPSPFSSPSPFAFSFPPAPPPLSALDASPGLFPPSSPLAAAEDDDAAARPLTAPEHPHAHPHDGFFLPPRLAHDRLAHRRGSSLDRALASSSIAGVFGGSLLKSPCPAHWSADPAISGDATPTEDTASSGGATPALSPQSSFESASSAASYSPHRAPSPPRGRLPRAGAVFPLSPPAPHAKVPTRLFGSQGVRLGLDLDLDLGLDLDLAREDDPMTPFSSAGLSPPSATYPYSPRAPSPRAGGAPYNTPDDDDFSYTQALMDTDPAVGADEFRAATPAAPAVS